MKGFLEAVSHCKCIRIATLVVEVAAELGVCLLLSDLPRHTGWEQYGAWDLRRAEEAHDHR